MQTSLIAMSKAHTKAEVMPFASGFVCLLEFIVTGNNTN